MPDRTHSPRQPDELRACGVRLFKELRTANEILKKASACFAQAELDRPFRR